MSNAIAEIKEENMLLQGMHISKESVLEHF